MSELKALVEGKFGKCTTTRGPHGQEYLVFCPFCAGQHRRQKRKLSINFNIRGFKCWRCGKHGNVFELFEGELKNIELPKNVDAGPVILPEPNEVVPPGALCKLSELDADHIAIKYLTQVRSRVFDPVELDRLGTLYCTSGRVFGGDSDMWYNTTRTLIFPMVHEGKLRGWQSRLLFEPDLLTDDQKAVLDVGQSEDGDWNFIPKYLTAPGFPRGEVFYNWDNAMQTTCLVVCEGVFDALAVGPSGIAGLGKGLGVGQLRRLREAGKPIVLLLDPDARETAHNYHMELSVIDLPVFNVCLTGDVDAGDMETADIWDQINRHIANKTK